MTKLELARKCANIGDTENALSAYTLALNENKHKDSMIDFECAVYILQFEGDYKLSLDTFTYLYNKGLYQNDIFDILLQAFYEPNIKKQEIQYKKNLNKLEKYNFIFNKEFEPFEDLQIKFFPYDDEYYIPFYMEENRFGEKVNFNYEEVTHNFFHNLDNPVLAKDIYSQYELEYLNDMVRPSEWVARENHIYLHYSSFEKFCSYLQVLDFSELIKDKKMIFLFDSEIEKYPIDFKKEYDIDYTKYSVKPIDIREVKKLIWSMQISAGNGGDFFNEVFDSHPNLLMMHSIMFDSIKNICMNKKNIKKKTKSYPIEFKNEDGEQYLKIDIIKYLYKYLPNITEKDVLISIFLSANDNFDSYDKKSRIVPALYVQPHFDKIVPEANYDEEKGILELQEGGEKEITKSNMLNNFKYIKSFAPLRRFTTSYGCAMKFELSQTEDHVLKNDMPKIFLVRNYMISKDNRFYKDCRLVRFEDGKLNPEATFTALANFLDIPYTDSMKYCSLYGEKNMKSFATNVIGFDTTSVYKKYEDILDISEKYLIEYAHQNAYKYYGYDFEYYDNKQLDDEQIEMIVDNCNKYITHYLETAKYHLNKYEMKIIDISEDFSVEYYKQISYKDEKEKSEMIDDFSQKYLKLQMDRIKHILKMIKPNDKIVNKNGTELKFMPMIEPIKELMVNPKYR